MPRTASPGQPDAPTAVPIDKDMRALQARLAHHDKVKGAHPRLWQLSILRIEQTAQGLEILTAQHPDTCQAPDLLARAGLLLMRLDTGKTRLALQPAVSCVQAGAVLEAWRAARACADRGGISDSDVQKLTAGGYRPRSTGFPTQ